MFTRELKGANQYNTHPGSESVCVLSSSKKRGVWDVSVSGVFDDNQG